MTDKNINPYEHKPSSGESKFFILEDGESARIRIMSDPFIFRSGFTDKVTGETRYSTRYGWVVYNFEVGMAQVMKQSGTFFSNLKALVADPEYGDPKTYDLKITREGTGTATKYQIVAPRTSQEVPEEKQMQAADMNIDDFNELQILPLSEYMQNGGKFPEPAAAPSGDVIVKDTAKEDNPL